MVDATDFNPLVGLNLDWRHEPRPECPICGETDCHPLVEDYLGCGCGGADTCSNANGDENEGYLRIADDCAECKAKKERKRRGREEAEARREDRRMAFLRGER